MRKAFAVAALLTTVGLGLAARSIGAGASVDPQSFDQLERGRYLTVAGDCAACHAMPGSSQMSGGRPIETPFGKLLAPNITPDGETGIGAWSDDEVINSLTKGTGRHGELLYPAMPYTYMTLLTHDDALAIRAYLKTVPPVHNEVRSNQLPFPFDIRANLVVWNKLYFTPGPYKPHPDKSAEWNRGAYLVEGVAHCGMCHTPKTFLGGDETSRRLQGYRLQGQFAPDITGNQQRGLGRWSIDEIVAYLATGHNATSAATGLMAEMVQLSTSKMNQPDLKAIATYLKDQPEQDHPAAAPVETAILKIGENIYRDECSSCHGRDGSGVAGLFPALKAAPVVAQDDATSLIRIVLAGGRSAATDGAPTAPAMPAFAWLLTDEQVADVVNYVRNGWGNSAGPISVSAVTEARKTLGAQATE